MARERKEKEHAAKVDDILDATQRAIYERGYQQVTIQDILTELHISKGAFYHYFRSKQEVFEALIDRMGRQGLEAILPIINDDSLTALQKFERYCNASARVKMEKSTLVIGMLRMWYADENAFIRQKLATESQERIAEEIFEPIISQGIRENVFHAAFPRESAVIVSGIIIHLGDEVSRILLSSPESQTPQKLQRTYAAYFDAIERVIGASPGSLITISDKPLQELYDALKG